MKEDRVVIVAKAESTYGIDAIAPDIAGALAANALLVSNCDVQTNADTLERNNYSPSISKDNLGTGRMLYQLTFTHELKASGVLGTAPRIGTLLRACGFAETIVAATAAATIGNAIAGAANSNPTASATIAGMTKTTAPTGYYDTYRITCTTAGAIGTAKFSVTGPGFPTGETTVAPSFTTSYWTGSAQGTVTLGGTIKAPTITIGGTWAAYDVIELIVLGVRFYYQVPVGGTATATIAGAIRTLIVANALFSTTGAVVGSTITVAYGPAEIATVVATPTAITLASSGAVVTVPVWAGALAVGDYWDVPLLQPGVRYDPVSDTMTSASFWVYMDGMLFRLTGARGTFQISGQAGQYPTIAFTFTGMYNDPIDMAIPTSGLGYEQSKPYKVELANLQVYGIPAVCAQSFSMDIANSVVAKDCINASEAYDEIIITERTPTFGCNPETKNPSVFSPWNIMRKESDTRLHVRCGYRGGVGNIVRVQGDSLYYTAMNFSNRNKIRAQEFNFRASRVTDAGNDECFLHFG